MQKCKHEAPNENKPPIKCVFAALTSSTEWIQPLLVYDLSYIISLLHVLYT